MTERIGLDSHDTVALRRWAAEWALKRETALLEIGCEVEEGTAATDAEALVRFVLTGKFAREAAPSGRGGGRDVGGLGRSVGPVHRGGRGSDEVEQVAPVDGGIGGFAFGGAEAGDQILDERLTRDVGVRHGESSVGRSDPKVPHAQRVEGERRGDNATVGDGGGGVTASSPPDMRGAVAAFFGWSPAEAAALTEAVMLRCAARGLGLTARLLPLSAAARL